MIYNTINSSNFEKFIEFQIDNISNAGDVSYFNQSIKKYLSSIISKDSLTVLQARNYNLTGFTTNSGQIDGFELSTSLYSFDQGYHLENLIASYSSYLENNNINPIQFLENINLSKIEDNSNNDFYIENSYYMPKSQYSTKAPISNKYVLAKNGKYYNDYFHGKSDGTFWTRKAPLDCPCEKLVTKEVYNKSRDIIEKNNFENITDFNSNTLARSLSWYYMLNKRFNESENLFNAEIIYSNRYTFSYTGYTSIYKEFKSNPNDLTFLKLAPIILKHKIRDIKKMSVLNRIHLMLLKGKVAEAIEAYKSVGVDSLFLDHWQGMSVFDVIKIDLKDFEEKGLIDKSTKEKVISELGI